MKARILGIVQGQFTNKETNEVINFNTIHLLDETEETYLGGIPFKESLSNKLFVELKEINEMLKSVDDSILFKEIELEYNMRNKKINSIKVLGV